jgi:fructokinase
MDSCSGTRKAGLGIDLGGTKIEGIVLAERGVEVARRRVAAPRGDYDATLQALVELKSALERDALIASVPLGLCIPGGISKRTGLVHNANLTWLNGRDLADDLARRLGERVVIANDANCFALSEATDGAAAGAATVFGVILGTGTGGGIVHAGRVIDGPLGIAGEWGHNPLPWPSPDEYPGPRCWCGRYGCMEAWVSGPALAADYARTSGQTLSAEDIVAAADTGDTKAESVLDRHASRLARGLAHVVNMLDPDVIVLGGGLSRLAHLYERLPALVIPHIFADNPVIDIRPPKWGDASGVRGAAWLTEAQAG